VNGPESRIPDDRGCRVDIAAKRKGKRARADTQMLILLVSLGVVGASIAL
jgi:hypothetical protein